MSFVAEVNIPIQYKQAELNIPKAFCFCNDFKRFLNNNIEMQENILQSYVGSKITDICKSYIANISSSFFFPDLLSCFYTSPMLVPYKYV